MTFDIKQIIPCTVEMWAVYLLDDGSELRNRVIAFALCGDGCIRPLEFDAELGIDEACGNLIRYERGEDYSVTESLHRIAVSLEALTQCISVDRGSSFFSITGNVDTCQL